MDVDWLIGIGCRGSYSESLYTGYVFNWILTVYGIAQL